MRKNVHFLDLKYYVFFKELVSYWYDTCFFQVITGEQLTIRIMFMKKEHDYILDYRLDISNENSTQNLELENKSTKHEHEGKMKIRKKKVAKAEQIECPSCGLIFPSKDTYKSHKRQHLTVDCKHCGKSLSYNTDFRIHQRRCTKDISFDHPCTICKKTMKTRYELDRHYEKRHTAKIVTKLYQCTLCDFEISNQRVLRKHVTTHKIHKTQDNYIVLQSHELKKCPKCNKQFLKEESLARHLKTHNFKRCSMCDYKSKKTSNLKAHTWRMHLKPKNAQSKPKPMPKCSYCDYTSNAQFSVTRHQESCSFAGPEIFCIV